MRMLFWVGWHCVWIGVGLICGGVVVLLGYGESELLKAGGWLLLAFVPLYVWWLLKGEKAEEM